MTDPLPDELVDDVDAVERRDPSGLLRAVAGAGAQVRTAALAYADAHDVLARVVADGRPRSVVVAGVGDSGFAGDVLAAVLGPRCPVPVTTVRDYALPGWVGAMDLMLAVSSSGRTEETLALVDEAARRGVALVGVGAVDSPLAERVIAAGGAFVGARPAMPAPRAALWPLVVPLLLLADDLGFGSVPAGVVERTADQLDQLAERYAPSSLLDGNAAKALAVALQGSIPVVWGTGVIGGAAATRCAAALNENAKYPAVVGALPEAAHHQVVTFDGPFAGATADDDLFRDRVDDPFAQARLHLVLLRDVDEHPQVARRADAAVQLAEERGLTVTEIRAVGEHPLERLASLVALGDFASVYLGVLAGVDPTPVSPVTELKRRIAAADEPRPERDG